MTRFVARLSCVVCVFLALAVCYVNVDAIRGAFGDGPPHYARTTNMDKWMNPIPVLLVLDLVAAALIFLIGRWACRRIR